MRLSSFQRWISKYNSLLMPRRMMKMVGTPVASGLFVLIAGIDCMMTLNDQKHTTTFLNCNSSTIGRNVAGV